MITNKIIQKMKSSVEKLEEKKNSRIFKYFLICASFVFIVFVAFLIYFFVKYGPIVLSLYEQRYIYKRIITASVDSSIPASASIDHTFHIPIKNEFDYAVPVKTVVKVPVNQKFNVTFDKPLNIPIDHVFRMDEKLNIKTEFPFETKVTIKILGVNIDVPVKGVMPLNLVIPLKHDFHIKDTLAVKLQESLPVPINSVFDVPLDFVLHGKTPIDGMLSVPIKDTVNVDVILRDKLPVTLQFSSFFDQKKVIESDNINKRIPVVPGENIKAQQRLIKP
ncbi:hypothetical protein DS62_00540 [Smithella sp. SC_K08D17]|nr:hypothetical protein KD27_05750 [Smithella sp. D17]KIE18087.1 hypothetical protein DS62_00540 [Smithella sp. SC_K08D17]